MLKEGAKKEIISLFYICLFALAIRTFVLELFFVPTPSMSRTILAGDYVFSTKYSYGYSKHSFLFSPNLFSGRIFESKPERGDIIVFETPLKKDDKKYIKRLIGLPGDKIKQTGDLLYINGVPIERVEQGKLLNEDGAEYTKFLEILPNGVKYFSYKLSGTPPTNTEIFEVPEGKYFFMGDNRDNSNDSRYDLGFIPFENLIAKSRFILFSTKEELWKPSVGFFEQIGRIWLWIKSFRLDRMLNTI